MRHRTILFLAAIATVLAFSQSGADPWPKSALLDPADLAALLRSNAAKPVVISVAFPALYRSKHILHAIDAGPTSKPEGIEALKKAVANLKKDADIVIYCGCCPMVRCPNVHPAFQTLQTMGFTHVRVLDIATNMHTDWYSKDYPSENGPDASPQH